ncbi:hypothetical protein G9G63_04470 [Paenibacillus sp. EKM202P]|uniref:Uncharacterized protein n=1 Tax=Paenibacillus ottowii TaxID=2315729 RepID=A0ABY3B526_9BACL|nr:MULTISPECIES: hypothetical protein [Paenibacillus]KAF6565710.1 hypothetical protein G9G64_20945 [Paenibacillus sp. EKM207P]KAF6566652.1 hypothetical protein G9G63_04470 [Paenibacillus sp. EKM202P]KZE76811.1 hypothetical protein AV545_10500 [Paenibacillus jamilae]NEU25473.1 hypothetical protein [Paenibacillus polymyxa]OBA01676.1 hypothetical protein A9P44_07175 [Paenibacillus polymyxa]
MTPFEDNLHGKNEQKDQTGRETTESKHQNQPINRDHAEQYPTDQESLFDRFEIEQTVDAIPVEDLKMERQEERDKDVTKHTSSSEKKYNGNV